MNVTILFSFYKNDKYYNLNIKGTSKQAGFYYQEEGSWDEWDGKNVIVKAYLIQQYNYFNVIPYDVVECDEHKKLNLKMAEESIVLLKNKKSKLIYIVHHNKLDSFHLSHLMI